MDAKRQEKLQQHTIKQYAEKARSAFYQQEGDRRAMLTFEVFAMIARQYSRSAKIWLNQLAKLSLQEVSDLLQQIPDSRISPIALEFGYRMLEINRSRLLRLQKDLT